MSMFQRKPRDDEEEQPYESDPSAPHPASVGHLLRSTRESLGWDLRDVASALRIRADYLAALERNTVEGLPGVAYATGFLRAYADYLGLDGNEIVSRFKSEKKTLASRPELSFPVPLTDRGIPGSGLFLIALLLITLAYGTWHYMSSGERPAAPEVEPVPARLLPPPPIAEAPPAPAPEQTADAAKPTTDAAAPTAAPAPLVAGPTPVAAAPAAPAPNPSFQSSIGAPQIAAAPAVPAPAAAAKPGAKPAAPTAATPNVIAPGITQAPGQAPVNTDGALPAVPPETAAADSKEPKTYGSFANPGRIVVKAKGYVWIQVYDGKETILTRTLHPGDSYYPPSKPGLIMRTGSAGGLTFVVDGKDLPPIGPTGMVKKKIPLDPQRLLTGDLGEDVPATPKPAPATSAPAAPAASSQGEDTPE
jgi:cytoskeleton protein RodZ